MTLTMRDHLVPAKHRLVSKGTNTRRYLTIHETANTGAGADAAAHARLQANGNSRKASWHWTVDDHEAVRSYEHTAICWHAGNSRGSAVSIAVEICVNSDGNRAQAIRNAAALVAKIRRDENIPAANVVQHNHWSGKNCPTGLRDGVPMGWASFQALVRTEHAALTGTTTPTSLLASTVTVPAIPVGSTLSVEIVGRYLNNTGANRTVTIGVKFDSTTLVEMIPTGTGAIGSAGTDRTFRCMFTIALRGSNDVDSWGTSTAIGTTAAPNIAPVNTTTPALQSGGTLDVIGTHAAATAAEVQLTQCVVTLATPRS